ncbi:MAG: DUF6111 family protein [Dichotomicrobium sp.]
MIRVILINLFLFLLPFIIYFAYVYLIRSARGKNEPISLTPLIVLFCIGLGLMVGAVAYFIQFESGEPGQRYVPPRVENGVLQPGRLE